MTPYHTSNWITCFPSVHSKFLLVISDSHSLQLSSLWDWKGESLLYNRGGGGQVEFKHPTFHTHQSWFLPFLVGSYLFSLFDCKIYVMLHNCALSPVFNHLGKPPSHPSYPPSHPPPLLSPFLHTSSPVFSQFSIHCPPSPIALSSGGEGGGS